MIEDKATERWKELAKKLGLILNASAGTAAKPARKNKGGRK